MKKYCKVCRKLTKHKKSAFCQEHRVIELVCANCRKTFVRERSLHEAIKRRLGENSHNYCSRECSRYHSRPHKPCSHVEELPTNCVAHMVFSSEEHHLSLFYRDWARNHPMFWETLRSRPCKYPVREITDPETIAAIKQRINNPSYRYLLSLTCGEPLILEE